MEARAALSGSRRCKEGSGKPRAGSRLYGKGSLKASHQQATRSLGTAVTCCASCSPSGQVAALGVPITQQILCSSSGCGTGRQAQQAGAHRAQAGLPASSRRHGMQQIQGRVQAAAHGATASSKPPARGLQAGQPGPSQGPARPQPGHSQGQPGPHVSTRLAPTSELPGKRGRRV